MARYLATLAALLFACQPVPEPPSDPRAEHGAELVLEPPGPLDAASEVVRVRVELAHEPSEPPEDVLLIRGELSDYHTGRIQKRDLPKTLVERVVPALVWSEERSIVIAPSIALSDGETYSVASPLLGRIGTLSVSAAVSPPLLSRLWPPIETGAGSERVILCGAGEIASAPDVVRLDPGGYLAALTVVDRCVWLSMSDPLAQGTRVVPEPRIGALALDPAPLEHQPHEPPAGAVCNAAEIAIGPGCGSVEDDRMIVRSRSEPALWRIESAATSVLEPVAADGRLVVRGFEPASKHSIEISVLDLSGRLLADQVTIETGAARIRLVIDEVLANAAGPEPMQEWVELVNDGSLSVDTAGFVLEDLGGSTALPSEILAPGERALVVRDDFVLDDGLDVPVPASVKLLRVERLGKNGLGNSGEPLTLRAPDGGIVSRFPALAASKSGRSIARKRPWDLDDDSSAFALHADPGASPGSANVTE